MARQQEMFADENNSEQTPFSLTAASTGLESAPFQNKLNEAVCNQNDQNALLNTSMPSTIALDNSEVNDGPNNPQRLAIAAQRKQIELAIERAE